MVDTFTTYLLKLCKRFIPVVRIVSRNSSHPWLNDRCIRLVRDKQDAEGTAAFERLRDICSTGLKEEYDKYIQKTKSKITASSSSSKRWWKLANMLSLKAGHSSTIPPLKDKAGQWTCDAKGKADLFASTFGANFVLPPAVSNEYSDVKRTSCNFMSGFLPIRRCHAARVLRALKDDSSTGPDLIGTKVLSRFHKALANPTCADLTADIEPGPLANVLAH